MIVRIFLYWHFVTTVFVVNVESKNICEFRNNSFDDSVTSCTKVVKLETTKLIEGISKDWKLGTSKQFNFSFVTDRRWTSFPRDKDIKLSLNHTWSFSYCVNETNNVQYSISSVDFKNVTPVYLYDGTYLGSDYINKCKWFNYTITRENKNVQIINDIKIIANLSLDYSPVWAYQTTDFTGNLHNYTFHYSENISSISTYYNVTSDFFFLTMFVSVDEDCYLNITLEQNGRVVVSTHVAGFNKKEKLKQWKEVVLNSHSNGTAKLYINRGRFPNNEMEGFWAIDDIELCKIPTSTFPNISEHDEQANESCNCQKCEKCLENDRSGKLPSLLWPPTLVLPNTENNLTISLENVKYDHDGIPPQFYQIQYKIDEDNYFNYSQPTIYTDGAGIGPICITGLNRSTTEVKEIRVVLIANNLTCLDNAPVIYPQKDLFDVVCEDNNIQVVNWNKSNNSTDNAFWKFECSNQSFSTENLTLQSVDFKSVCLRYHVCLYDTYLPTNKTYLKRKRSGVCKNTESKGRYAYAAIIVIFLNIIVICSGISMGIYLCQKETYTNRDLQSTENTKLLQITKINNIEISEIELNEFAKKIKIIVENNLERQFSFFTELEAPYSSSIGRTPENINKNRNRGNTVPYDHNRIILQNMKGVGNGDYINASYIDGYDRPKAYIACQGPKFYTIRDFWRMVWQENVSTIVMTTSLLENKKRLCAEYWPQAVNGIYECGSIVIKCISDTAYESYSCRKLEVSYESCIRHVLQYQLHWTMENPEYFYPSSAMPVVKIIREFYESNSGPIVIHSRYGNGRAAVLILCDIALQMAKFENKIDFCSLTKVLRIQRPNMISSLKHYVFAHLIVDEFIKETNYPFENVLEAKINSDTAHAQLKYLEELSGNDKFFEKVVLNKEKNENSFLQVASVPHYGNIQKYLTVLKPSEEELAEFWKMVGREYVDCIVFLNTNGLTWSCRKESPPVTILVRGQCIPKSTYFSCGEISLLIYDTKSNQIIHDRNILVFEYFDWNSKHLVPNSPSVLIKFINEIQQLRNHKILLSCRDGCTASGLFIVISYILEKYKNELQIDVCNAIRISRRSGKNFVNSFKQLNFVYTVVTEYLANYDKYQQIQE